MAGKQRVPIIALGAMTFGGQTSESDADKMLGLFLDAGHTWVDTAFIYTEGRSEEILGRLLRGAKRGKVFLATKACPDRLGEGQPRGLTPGSVRGQLEISLKRLRMDGVDLLYLHQPDNRTPLEVTLGTCEELKAEGKIREVGLSNYASWQVAEAVGICRRNGWAPPTVYQGMYNAVTRAVEEECIPSCHHFGLRFMAYNPLAGGLLTAKYASVADVPTSGRFANAIYRARYWKNAYFQAIEVVAQSAKRARVPVAEAALRWLTKHSAADGLILGASRVEHLKQNLSACRKPRLSVSIVRALDAAWEVVRPECQRYWRE